MYPYLKNFLQLFLIALILNIVLSLNHAIRFASVMEEPITFALITHWGFLIQFIFALLVFSFGLLLFSGMAVIYTALGGKKILPVFLGMTVIIAILALTLRMGWHIGLFFGDSRNNLSKPFFLELLLPFGLMIILNKGLKENKWVAIITGAWFLITLLYYSYFSVLLQTGIFILG